MQHVLNTGVGRNCFSQKAPSIPRGWIHCQTWAMRSEGVLQSLPLLCPTLASQNADTPPEKEKQGNTRGAISLDDAASFPGARFCRVKVAPFTKENKGSVERIVIVAIIITVTIIIY